MMPTATPHRVAALHSPSGHSDPINNLLLFPIGGRLRSASEWVSERTPDRILLQPSACRTQWPLKCCRVIVFISSVRASE